MIAPYGGNVVIDLGTGDGLFVYHEAKKEPSQYFIGIDANVKPLQKLSEKISRKPSKGGSPNSLFLRASLEDLPQELSGIASQVRVHYPWGSLLAAVAGTCAGLERIKGLCQPSGRIYIVMSFDPSRDAAELERLGIRLNPLALFQTQLTESYRRAGLNLNLRISADPPNVQTSWGSRLKNNPGRMFLQMEAWP